MIRRIGLVLAIVTWSGLAAAKPTEPLKRVTIQVENIRNDRGVIRVALYERSTGWLRSGQATCETSVKARWGKVQVVCMSKAAGPISVAVVHDEDEDGKLSTGLFGIPIEGYGFSRGARGVFGPPGFNQAAVLLRSKQPVVGVNLSY